MGLVVVGRSAGEVLITSLLVSLYCWVMTNIAYVSVEKMWEELMCFVVMRGAIVGLNEGQRKNQY